MAESVQSRLPRARFELPDAIVPFPGGLVLLAVVIALA